MSATEKGIIMNNNAKMRTINPSVFVSKYGIIRATDDMLFVGVDVARAFGYGKSNAMINCPLARKHRLEVWEDNKLKTVVTATFITLYDCMQLYHFSKLDKEDRDAVKEFIFDEIVPTLSEAQKGYLSFRKKAVGKVPVAQTKNEADNEITRLYDALGECKWKLKLAEERNIAIAERLHEVMDCCQRNCGRLHTKYCNHA